MVKLLNFLERIENKLVLGNTDPFEFAAHNRQPACHFTALPSGDRSLLLTPIWQKLYTFFSGSPSAFLINCVHTTHQLHHGTNVTLLLRAISRN